MSLSHPRRIAAVLAGVAALTLAAACGAGSQTGAKTAKTVTCDFTKPSSSTTVRVLAYNSSAIDPYTNTMVKSCTKDNVTVSHDPIDFAGQDSKTPVTLSGASATYDILEVYGFEMPNYISKGKFQDLDDLWNKYKDKYQLDGLDKSMLQALMYKGKIYGVPMQANVTTFVYRKDIFDSLGIAAPKTVADVVAAAQKIKASGKMQHPIAFPFSDPDTFFEAGMNSEGVPVYADAQTKKGTFDTPQAKKVMSALVSMVPYMDPQVTSFDQPKVQQQLYSGNAAMAMMYSGRMADLTNSANSSHSKDFAFASLTLEPGGKAFSNLSVDGWAIPANTKISPDLLFNIIGSSVTADASKAALPFAYPARTSALEGQDVPYADSVTTSLKNGALSAPPWPWVTPISTATTTIFINALTGKLSQEAALTQAQAAATKALAAAPADQFPSQ